MNWATTLQIWLARTRLARWKRQGFLLRRAKTSRMRRRRESLNAWAKLYQNYWGSPNAKGAVCALKALNRVSVTQGTESLGEEAGTAMLYAQRCVRDVVVMRCCSRDNPRDRGAFLVAVAEAFGDPLDDLLRSQLCLAFRKIVGEDAPKPARGSGGAVACSRSPSAPRGRM